jgi:ribulose-5-phosphate 4-epimerase/fuculose-1-phosphate aldolase
MLINNNEDLILLSKKVSKFVVGMEGNVSKKTDFGISIKASGTKLETLTDDDIINYDFNGNQLNKLDKKGSMELGFHLYLLTENNINFISHTHPTNTLKILSSNLSELFANNRIFPDQVIFNGKKSCLVPYATPGNDLTKVIKESVLEYKNNENEFPKLILLKNHGIISCGKTIDECIIISEICEKAAEIFIDTITLGGVNFLTEDDIEKLINDKQEKYRKSLL